MSVVPRGPRWFTQPRLDDVVMLEQHMASMPRFDAVGGRVRDPRRGNHTGVSFDPPNHPDRAPDLLNTTRNPDASYPDNWARIFENAKGSLNWLLCFVLAAETEMDLGLHTTTAADVHSYYGKAGDLLEKSGCFDSIADVQEVIVAHSGYTGWAHQLSALVTARLASLKLR